MAKPITKSLFVGKRFIDQLAIIEKESIEVGETSHFRPPPSLGRASQSGRGFIIEDIRNITVAVHMVPFTIPAMPIHDVPMKIYVVKHADFPIAFPTNHHFMFESSSFPRRLPSDGREVSPRLRGQRHRPRAQRGLRQSIHRGGETLFSIKNG